MGWFASIASTVRYSEQDATSQGGATTPLPLGSAQPGHSPSKVEKLSPPLHKRGVRPRGRRPAASPAATIVKRTTVKLTKEERAA